MDVLWFVLKEEEWEHHRVKKFLMIAWAIWTNRNDSRHGRAKKTSQGLLQWSLDYLAEYQAYSLIPTSSKTSGVVN